MRRCKIFNVSIFFFLVSSLFVSCSKEDLIIDNNISSFHISTGEIYPAFHSDVKKYNISFND